MGKHKICQEAEREWGPMVRAVDKVSMGKNVKLA